MSSPDEPVRLTPFVGRGPGAGNPRETLDLLVPRLGSVGITRVANLTGLDRIGMPVACAIRPESRSLCVSLGKGLTREAAEVSAILEGFELFHAEHIDLPMRFGTHREIGGEVPVVDLAGLPRSNGGRQPGETAMWWVEAATVDGTGSTWVPMELVHTDACLPEPEGSGCFCSTSNGLGAGSNLPAAILHGLCEAVERDSTALFRLRPDEETRACRVELGTIDDVPSRGLLEAFARAGLGTLVWDCTSDLGVPAFTCTLLELHEGDAGAPLTSNGAGCHPRKGVALLRALTEAAQSRLTLISGSRDDMNRSMYVGGPEIVNAYRRLLREADEPGIGSFAAGGSVPARPAAEDIALILPRLAAAGVGKPLWVDLTRSEIGVPVVRVIVPGLETSAEISDYSPGERATRAMRRA